MSIACSHESHKMQCLLFARAQRHHAYEKDGRLKKIDDDPRYFNGAELGKAQKASLGITGLVGHPMLHIGANKRTARLQHVVDRAAMGLLCLISFDDNNCEVGTQPHSTPSPHWCGLRCGSLMGVPTQSACLPTAFHVKGCSILTGFKLLDLLYMLHDMNKTDGHVRKLSWPIHDITLPLAQGEVKRWCCTLVHAATSSNMVSERLHRSGDTGAEYCEPAREMAGLGPGLTPER
eukprot:6467876-Amphidinium_carterae.3